MAIGHGARMRGPAAGRSAFTFPELVIVAAAAGVLVAVVCPTLSRCRSLTRRAGCQRNLTLALHGLRLYAEDHGGAFPTCGFGAGTRRFDVIGWRLTRRVRVAHSNSRNLFLAVRVGFVRPGMLICPATEDVPASPGPPARPYHDFNVGRGPDYRNKLSYSYHLQFRRRSRAAEGYPLTTRSDPSLAVLADRTPCVRYPGAGYGSGTMARCVGIPAGVSARRANSPHQTAPR